MPLSSPEEVLAVARAYAAPPATSNVGAAFRIANKILRSGASGPIAGEPSWVKRVPFRGQEWRRKEREEEKQKAFGEVAKHCCSIPDAAILPFLKLLTEALRIGPKLRAGPRGKKELCCAEVHEAYAHAWSRRLDVGGRETIEREMQTLQNELDRRAIGSELAERRRENVKRKFFPTRDEVRAILRERISVLLDGDEAHRSNATEIAKILKGKHFSDYSGKLKFAETGTPTA